MAETDKLEKFRKSIRDPFVVAIFGFVVIIFIIIIITIAQLFRSNQFGDEIKITNLGDYVGDMPLVNQDSIKRALYLKLQNGSQPINDEEKLKSATGVIRDGTAVSNYDESLNIHSGNFIVDIDSLKRSYIIYYQWSNDSNNDNISSESTVINCVPADKVIYPEFVCEESNDTYGESFPELTISSVLPKFGTIVVNGETIEYSLFWRSYSTPMESAPGTSGAAENPDPEATTNERKGYIEVDANTCGIQEAIDEMHKTVEEWIKSFKISPSDIDIQYRDLCDGGAA